MQFTITSLREVIRQEVEQAIQPLLAQLTKLTVNSVSNGIPPAAAAQATAKLPPERVAILVRQAKNLYAQGLSWAEIAKQWNAKGVPTLSGIGQWHGATVARLVRNEWPLPCTGIHAAFEGQLGREAELRATKKGKLWLSFSLAVDTEGEDDALTTTWVRVAYFGEDAESLIGRLQKGTEVYCEGRLRLAIPGPPRTVWDEAAFP
jgi:hypothetical protein